MFEVLVPGNDAVMAADTVIRDPKVVETGAGKVDGSGWRGMAVTTLAACRHVVQGFAGLYRAVMTFTAAKAGIGVVMSYTCKAVRGMTVTTTLTVRTGWNMCNELADADRIIVTVITCLRRIVNTEVMIEYTGRKRGRGMTTAAIQRRFYMVGMHQQARAVT